MKTTYELKLESLKAEQLELLKSKDSRKKSVRDRIKQITAEFFNVKEEWRAYELSSR